MVVEFFKQQVALGNAQIFSHWQGKVEILFQILDADVVFQLLVLHLELQLGDEAALFRHGGVGRAVVGQQHILRTLQQPEEVVGIDLILVKIVGQRLLTIEFILEIEVSPAGKSSVANISLVYFSTYFGTSGRAPTKVISPIKILISCGNSSNLNFLSILPILVILGSLLLVKSPCFSEFSYIVLNFNIKNSFPY